MYLTQRTGNHKDIVEEQSRFWIDRGQMNLEITDSYQELYYKHKTK